MTLMKTHLAALMELPQEKRMMMMEMMEKLMPPDMMKMMR